MNINTYKNIKGLDKTYLIGLSIFVLICTIGFAIFLIIIRIFLNYPIIKLSIENGLLLLTYIFSIILFAITLSLLTFWIPANIIKYTFFVPYKVEIGRKEMIFYNFFHKRKFKNNKIRLKVNKKYLYIYTNNKGYKYYHISREIIDAIRMNVETI